MDYKLDESYTPNKIAVRAGNSFYDLKVGYPCVCLGQLRTAPASCTVDPYSPVFLRIHNIVDVGAFLVFWVQVKIGLHVFYCQEIMQIELDEPQGWISIPLTSEKSGDCMKALLLQIAVLTNHQNGRDTHVRQIRLYGPRTDPIKALGYGVDITSAEILRYAYIR